jgi:predicted transposase/invertase (TIGR01784 family)
MSASRSDQDSPWKDILRQYFPEAIAFFFPETSAQIDWSQPHEFLDKEFQQIAPNAEIGKRYADQLVKVWLKQGQQLWLLVHIEIQAKPETNFAERMLVYHLRIFDRFHSHATSLAILCDRNANWRPNQYRFSSPDTELTFRFGMIKLLDYLSRNAELEQSRNPFAVVVMAHIQAQETQRDSQGRKDRKLSLIRRLYEEGYERREIVNLFRFVDWVMILPKGLESEFWQELKVYEEERRMPYITSVERIGFERGVEQGLEQGAQREARSLILRQLTRKVGELPQQVRSQIDTLSITQLEMLGEALLDFSSLSDLEVWLAQQEQ